MLKEEESARADPGRFHPAPLPKWELKLCYAVWAIHSIGAFYVAFKVCTGPLRAWIEGILLESSFLPGWSFDPSDTEWQYVTGIVGTLLAAFSTHSIVFHLTYRFLTADHARLVQIAVGAALHLLLTSASCMLILAAFAALCNGLSAYFRREAIAWILCIGFIIKVGEFAPFSADSYTLYREFNVYLYASIKILNVCIALSRNPEKKLSIDWSLGIAHYLTYLPYSTILIEFEAQIERRTKSEDKEEAPFGLRSNLFFALRLALWSTIYQCLIHFIPVGALFSAQAATSLRLNGYQMFSLAYLLGEYFHLKYTVIFGVPALFARIDGLTPPPPPICISRVSRYSRMWRHFDAGLYSFLKNQVYIPLLTNPHLTANLARPLSLVSAFLIVVAWHGSQRNYVCWVCLSALELVIERTGASIWDSRRFQTFRVRIGEVWLRRLLACCMNLTVAPGILGVFYFLGGDEFGDALVKRILLNGLADIANLNIAIVNGVPSAGLVLSHLLVLGYFFNQSCLELEFANRKAPEARENNNNNNNTKKLA